ncbi:signal peptidase I [Candidatus Roizmanbacteria bacterium RIFCSPLOWO2_02_FULL_37_9]|uniref:Signal peptidase I n=1 Tax=Candidatus Roizmanbacteria bacterium RIFCSPLOWO2_01_FULL_37_16 TaxID=1802058 RepID=A0A1F7IMW4_9BACT|nr:MAG: signal peptidase I [Candidatus Daviesbacteria bacterium RIFCSPHIGHO2_02_FULL_39_8]OGK32201.1 MAG: signal peptidase I [Candidatus Roizmanbacteria bacterium RIFCSPHIGHO2_12_FULL_36_11]OGK44660.1 MAG: signal peptidase I [Candidatus Roizmanbacteria bacterium RIFCSPLOWO2_01_FULL_37_16]OGK55784.1 MAG: signal peptidase I [Candidatus Roizmanbacteria bacterium RIFCSPLOWO2_02_FULL_37_9]
MYSLRVGTGVFHIKLMEKTVGIIAEQILKGLVFGILPFFIFVLITSRSPIFGGIRSFVVVSGSMEPALPVGTLVFTHPFDLYRPNDVIAFKKNDKIITHRVVDLESKNGSVFYKTMGDANNVFDSELISQSDVLGTVFFAISNIGKIVFFIKTVPGYLILIVLPAAIFIIFELMNINIELEKEAEKKLLQKMQMI